MRVEKAKSATAMASTIGNQETTLSKASEVRTTPSAPVEPVVATSSRASSQLCGLAMTIVRAVMVQMITVSTNGSSRATKPSETGRWVLTAEWAMGAEPMPASLEKAARWKPTMSAPSTPPATPSGLKALVTMALTASGTWPMLPMITTRQAIT